jgi:hypothetical protein
MLLSKIFLLIANIVLNTRLGEEAIVLFTLVVSKSFVKAEDTNYNKRLILN